MEASELYVHHTSETNDQPLKVEVEVNSKGPKYLVSYRGKDEQDVLDTVERVLAEIKRRVEREDA